MKNVLELKPEELPIKVRLKTATDTREYILLLTKQGRLLLNKFVLTDQN